MLLILGNDMQFNVNSFSESLSINKEENFVMMNLNVHVAYAEPLENLVALTENLDASSFVIKGANSEDQRAYLGFDLESINQNVNDFHNIETVLIFTKCYNEN